MAKGQWGGALETKPLQVKVLFNLGTERCQTGFHARRIAASFASEADIAADVAAWASAQFRKLLSPNDRLVAVDVLDVQTKEGSRVDFDNLVGLTGDASTAALVPSFVQVPVSMKSAQRTRWGQGRMLWPVRQEGSIDGNVLSAGGRALVQGVVDSFVAEYVGNELTGPVQAINVHGVLAAGRPNGSRPDVPAVPQSWYDVESVRIGPILGALRSRKQGIGT